ncbi:MvdC/MvdD family ATP grasp protein [Actinacidiphila oryziradicis]|uniref:MvdC/MvdD family ATP grasp protein n=1 Tax=Actinacidiphila oryziradicis TaxID=2571141 RepID=UPI003899148B
MGAAPVVLVAAERRDPTADMVVSALTKRGAAVFRFDVADFPRRIHLDAQIRDGRSTGVIGDALRTVRLEQVRGVYWRRPGPAGIAERMSVSGRQVALAVQATLQTATGRSRGYGTAPTSTPTGATRSPVNGDARPPTVRGSAAPGRVPPRGVSDLARRVPVSHVSGPSHGPRLPRRARLTCRQRHWRP